MLACSFSTLAWQTFSRPFTMGLASQLEQTLCGVAPSRICLLLERPRAARGRGGSRAEDAGGGPGHPLGSRKSTPLIGFTGTHHQEPSKFNLIYWHLGHSFCCF